MEPQFGPESAWVVYGESMACSAACLVDSIAGLQHHDPGIVYKQMLTFSWRCSCFGVMPASPDQMRSSRRLRCDGEVSKIGAVATKNELHDIRSDTDLFGQPEHAGE